VTAFMTLLGHPYIQRYLPALIVQEKSIYGTSTRILRYFVIGKDH